MRLIPAMAAGALCLWLSSCSATGQKAIQAALRKGTGTVRLPPEVTNLTEALVVPPGAHDLEIAGSPGTLLRASAEFNGRAMLMIPAGQRISIRDFAMDGNKTELHRPAEAPPASAAFVNAFHNNGILIEGAKDVRISNLEIRGMVGFAILAHGVKKIAMENIRVEDSGGRNTKGHNNTSGGILLEQGTEDFEVRNSTLKKVLGNGIWTRSTDVSARNYRGLIAGNRLEIIGRSAVLVGHANRVRVENNTGRLIGYPVQAVEGIPVAIGASGKVDEAVFTRNRIEEINGKCFDLDGFHDGEVSENVCINRGTANEYPNGQYALVMNNTFREMQSQLITIRDNVFDGTRFGGIFVIGGGHKVIRNKLRRLNLWHCNQGLDGSPCPKNREEPDLMQAGIFLAEKADRAAPARNNVIESNEISGWKMNARCVMASPRISLAENTVRNNRCVDSE